MGCQAANCGLWLCSFTCRKPSSQSGAWSASLSAFPALPGVPCPQALMRGSQGLQEQPMGQPHCVLSCKPITAREGLFSSRINFFYSFLISKSVWIVPWRFKKKKKSPKHKKTVPIILWAQRGTLLIIGVGYEEESLVRILLYGVSYPDLWKRSSFILGHFIQKQKTVIP